MFSWAGNATIPAACIASGPPAGNLAPRPNPAQPIRPATHLHEPLDPASLDLKNLQIKAWSLKRTANYGSNHYDEKPLEIRAAKLSANGLTLTLDIPDLRPTWCMEIQYTLRAADGTPVQGTIHNTIHTLAN